MFTSVNPVVARIAPAEPESVAPRRVRWQVAQHLDLAAAQRLQQRPRPGGRPRAWPASRLRMRPAKGGVGGALPGMTL
jgi:hypothetical protein